MNYESTWPSHSTTFIAPTMSQLKWQLTCKPQLIYNVFLWNWTIAGSIHHRAYRTNKQFIITDRLQIQTSFALLPLQKSILGSLPESRFCVPLSPFSLHWAFFLWCPCVLPSSFSITHSNVLWWDFPLGLLADILPFIIPLSNEPRRRTCPIQFACD